MSDYTFMNDIVSKSDVIDILLHRARNKAIDECLGILENSFNRATNTSSYIGASSEVIYMYGVKKTTILELRKEIEKLKSEGE